MLLFPIRLEDIFGLDMIYGVFAIERARSRIQYKIVKYAFIDTDIVDPIIPEFIDNNKNNELEDASSVDIEFQFPIEWALKSNQKFGKKEKGKRMKKQVKELLKSFFLNGNLNQKDRMLIKDMHNKLLNFVKSGELEAKDIPKILTIQN
ncbi:hypothetical protein GLOIN_2v1791933 [Rhizophagus clarus]|uniref:Uncharacterized protein n=1 Tax=Rhizophagus clarus TaxID=94130 RepID=A0A8H3KZK7_9GLOM|nr:hypothetical protein GLOIN_2v1791933 [Rhizophagus clarus]